MKYGRAYLFPLIVFAAYISPFIRACPTCVGSLTSQSAPFWSNNLYKNQYTAQREDEINSIHSAEASSDQKTVVKKMENTHDTQ